MTTKKQLQEEHIEKVKNSLREFIAPGMTVYTTLKHVSRSGMYRVISLHVIYNNEPRNIDWLASQLLEGYDERWNGCKTGGCGMDMGFHLVYNLSYRLFKDNFYCIGDNCPANDHNNPPYPPRIKDSMKHSDAGYALRQQWM